jgi:hypothetical protein
MSRETEYVRIDAMNAEDIAWNVRRLRRTHQARLAGSWSATSGDPNDPIPF